MKRRFILLLFSLVFLGMPAEAAPHRWIVHVEASAAGDATEDPEALFDRLGLRLLEKIRSGASDGVYIVGSDQPLAGAVLDEILESEPLIQDIEPVRRMRMSESSGDELELARHRAEAFARAELQAAGSAPPAVRYYRQPLKGMLRLGGVHRFYAGVGVVAIIDTGVDPLHPALVGSLVPGYDFILDRAGASEWRGLDPTLTAQLQQPMVAVLDQSTVAVLDQSTVAVLDQFAILNQSTVAVLDQELFDQLASEELAAFGHGTLVAGLVHLVAPDVLIMPLRAFRADGSSSTDDIIEAIYYAVDHGADVINMSFSFQSFSPEVMRAVNHATRNGVICVSAAGNLGSPQLVYPASFANVTGVAAVTPEEELSSLSSYGEDLVSIGALGEDVLSTYPGGRFASVFGTSFSAGIVAGAIALLRNVDEGIDQYLAEAALAMGRPRSGELGHGKLNLMGAVQWLRRQQDERDHDDDSGNDR